MTNRFRNLGAIHYLGAIVTTLNGAGFVAETALPVALVAFATKVFAKKYI